MPSSILYYVLLFMLLFTVFQVRTLLKSQAYKELIVAVVLFLLAGLYGLDIAFNWHYLPNPNALIYVLEPVSQALETLLQVTD
ncbi:Uncharacterized [Syntrophomonas zehnderi OL-4]|uniref:Uncharacterized n=1 Tax=Syntrophomonas zehnderi OL-4 TaxID=690567 RepID=A0A0E4GCA6_9FIRM|nr:hypothetical protein [Syntrophomonas zehnderi]CFX10293.1 Uncharacterized [Syntrophomonas zehnderi OL-4]